jgi:transcriptional regulator with XRE-family HTH domain
MTYEPADYNGGYYGLLSLRSRKSLHSLSFSEISLTHDRLHDLCLAPEAGTPSGGVDPDAKGVAAHIDECSASARINQYERGKHWPDSGTAERLARVMNVPAAFFYATDDALAEWILKFGRLNARNRGKLLEMADDLVEEAPDAKKTLENNSGPNLRQGGGLRVNYLRHLRRYAPDP